jgi:hypothetical protein
MTEIQKTAAVLAAIDSESRATLFALFGDDDASRLKAEISQIKALPSDIREHLNDFYELCLTQKAMSAVSDSEEEFDPNGWENGKYTCHICLCDEPTNTLDDDIREFVQRHAEIAALAIHDRLAGANNLTPQH